MGLNRLINISLITRLAIFLVLMMAIGMGLMALLIKSVYSTANIFFMSLSILILLYPIGMVLAKWVMQPILDIQTLARQWLKISADTREDDNEFVVLKKTLTELDLSSRDRIHALEDEKAKEVAILDSMVEGVIALDRHGRVILMNPAARHILGFGEGFMEGQSLLEVIRNHGLADLVEMCRNLKSHEQCQKDVELHLPIHRVLNVNAMPLPVSVKTGGVVLVFHDITELRRLEQVRKEFIANVSHELRTPLTAISGYLETLLDDEAPEPHNQRRFLEVAHSHAERLTRLINDLHKLSDIEAGKVILHSSSIELKPFITDLSAIFEKDALKKGVMFQNLIPSHVGVLADRDRLSQILVNLIDNAVKFTSPGGSIIFDAIIVDDERHLGIQIKDTGQGIPPGDLPRITERFYRVDKARSREDGGTGLGLAIVKHLVQLHGGRLLIDSEVGKGTTIKVLLPKSPLI